MKYPCLSNCSPRQLTSLTTKLNFASRKSQSNQKYHNFFFYCTICQNLRIMGAGTTSKGKTGGSSKEDELILQDFSRRVSAKSSALFYGNAFIVSAVPIWLYWRVHHLDPASSALLFAVVTLASTWLLAFAYKNTKHLLKHRVAVKREVAVTKEMSKKLDSDKKISRKEKDERILWKKNEVAEYESTTFSIFFNNALFLACLILFSFYILKGFSPAVNYVCSMTLAGGIVALLSTGSQI